MLTQFPAMRLSPQQLMQRFPNQQILRQASLRGLNVTPSDPGGAGHLRSGAGEL